jgi:hypothetical protein
VSPALFRRIGIALYGEGRHWPSLLAVDLAVAPRSVQRWASGAREIPDLSGELAALCHERARDLAHLADELATDSVPVG